MTAAARVGFTDVLGGWNVDRTATSLSSEGTRFLNPCVVRRRKKGALVAVMASSLAGVLSGRDDQQTRCTSNSALMIESRRNRNKNLPPVSPEKLDEWTRESVTEIVRNIGKAPFLVHLFSNGSESEEDSAPSSSSSVRVETEPVVSQNWHSIKRRWDLGGNPTPDGIILVEELKEDEEAAENEDNGINNNNFTQRSTNKTLGLLVQGRGVDCSACYILSTCRVLSSVGACTHFFLVRAKCSGDTADVQLRKAWLQQY